MNAYERRLVHTELATRPDVKTESIGEGSERHIVHYCKTTLSGDFYYCKL